MTYTITKTITVVETYSITTDINGINALELVEKDECEYFVDSEILESEYAIVNVEK